MLYPLYHRLCINGCNGVPDVWRQGTIANNIKPASRKTELKSGDLHNLGEPYKQICFDGDTNRQRYQAVLSLLLQQEAFQSFDQYPLGDQHRCCGLGRPFLRISDVTGWSFPQYNRIYHTTLHMLLEDYRHLQDLRM